MAPVSRVPQAVDGVQDERAPRDAFGAPGRRRHRAAWWRAMVAGPGLRRRGASTSPRAVSTDGVGDEGPSCERPGAQLEVRTSAGVAFLSAR